MKSSSCVRLDCCRVPRVVGRELELIDLFPHWERGLRKLLAALRLAGGVTSNCSLSKRDELELSRE
jgi:hypothetical protein